MTPSTEITFVPSSGKWTSEDVRASVRRFVDEMIEQGIQVEVVQDDTAEEVRVIVTTEE